MTDSPSQTDVLPSSTATGPNAHAAPKWAAVVDDRLIPLPRQRLAAKAILDQAQARPGAALIRDYNSPHDIAFIDVAEVDLAGGNVFRTDPQATRADDASCAAPPKLAFVVDDHWEVTIRPTQTGAMLRQLLDVPAEAELLRDYESPHDHSIEDGDEVSFVDGPVFRTRVGTVTVTVNNNPVRVPRHGTALSLKQAAIDQNVAIRIEFLLFRVRPDGNLSPPIPDDRHLTFHEGDEFRCVAPDDNS